MARISEIIIAHPEVTSFQQLEELVAQAARDGEIHLFMDIKPEYPDTPRKWEQQLELTFYRAEVKR
ncbi:MAG: sulfur relay protein DsrC [Hyphomicrobiales bacterium]|nr:sulfur relay protein DsrC [Hyphomicrobiales bacterium]